MGVSTEGGVLRRGSDRMLGGVCSGLAHYFQVDPVFVRVAFVALAFLPPGVGFWLYLALWVLMPPAQGHSPESGDLRGRVRMVFREFGEDWRSWFSPATGSSGTGSQPPPSTPPGSGGSTPSDPRPPEPPPSGPPWWGPGYSRRPNAIWGGVILVAIGIYFLLLNLGYLTWWRWDVFWPIVLIALGLLVLARRVR